VDTHQFTQTVRSCESLPEAVRDRACAIGEKLSRDEDRAELAQRLQQVDEEVRQAGGEAQQALSHAEDQVADIEHKFHQTRSEEEEHSQKEDVIQAEKKLNHSDRSSPSPS